MTSFWSLHSGTLFVQLLGIFTVTALHWSYCRLFAAQFHTAGFHEFCHWFEHTHSVYVRLISGYFSEVFLQHQRMGSQLLRQSTSIMKTNTLCFQRIGILVHILSWRQQKHQCLFSLLRFFDELFDVINDDPFLTL